MLLHCAAAWLASLQASHCSAAMCDEVSSCVLANSLGANMLTLSPADALSIKGFSCNAATYAPKIKTAVARALACTFANVFAGAIDAQTPGVAYTCSDTLAVSGYGTVCSACLELAMQCPVPNAVEARCCWVPTPCMLLVPWAAARIWGKAACCSATTLLLMCVTLRAAAHLPAGHRLQVHAGGLLREFTLHPGDACLLWCCSIGGSPLLLYAECGTSSNPTIAEPEPAHSSCSTTTWASRLAHSRAPQRATTPRGELRSAACVAQPLHVVCSSSCMTPAEEWWFMDILHRNDDVTPAVFAGRSHTMLAASPRAPQSSRATPPPTPSASSPRPASTSPRSQAATPTAPAPSPRPSPCPPAPPRSPPRGSSSATTTRLSPTRRVCSCNQQRTVSSQLLIGYNLVPAISAVQSGVVDFVRRRPTSGGWHTAVQQSAVADLKSVAPAGQGRHLGDGHHRLRQCDPGPCDRRRLCHHGQLLHHRPGSQQLLDHRAHLSAAGCAHCSCMRWHLLAQVGSAPANLLCSQSLNPHAPSDGIGWGKHEWAVGLRAGQYAVSVSATSTNVGDNAISSSLYLDSVTFTA